MFLWYVVLYVKLPISTWKTELTTQKQPNKEKFNLKIPNPLRYLSKS